MMKSVSLLHKTSQVILLKTKIIVENVIYKDFIILKKVFRVGPDVKFRWLDPLDILILPSVVSCMCRPNISNFVLTNMVQLKKVLWKESCGVHTVKAGWVTLTGQASSVAAGVGSHLPFNFIKAELIPALSKTYAHHIILLNLFTLNNYTDQVMASIPLSLASAT